MLKTWRLMRVKLYVVTFIDEIDDLILEAGFFEIKEQARRDFNRASELYSEARVIRSTDWRKACDIFIEAARVGRDAKTSVVPQDNKNKIYFWMAVIVAVLAVVGFFTNTLKIENPFSKETQ